MRETIAFEINGKPTRLDVDSSRMLLWVLRGDLGLTGTKFGCGRSYCGACTVIVNDLAVRSCITPVKSVAGKSVLTIEGLERNGVLHPLQQAFMDHDALQCGFCTPGMIMTTYGFLKKNPKPTRNDIIKGLDRNLCRCGAHDRIIRAVVQASRAMA